MLDKRMNYTCGYWKNANNLNEAQLAKLELICQKLMLKPGMRLLILVVVLVHLQNMQQKIMV